MTDRLYYADSYLTEFDGEILEVLERDGGFHARLDRSAFYPTSGGQPHDTGTLNGVPVTDVYVDGAGEVWHALAAPLAPGPAHGVIDWPRRFEHMQQHAADHMIANAIYRLWNGTTIGLHLGEETSTIDVAMPDGVTRITPEQIAAVEDDVNARIQRDVPVKCWFPAPEELAALPLRKAPTVQEHVRVVQIGAEEFVACGGTHPATAGQIGVVKILDARPSRGKMRVEFVAGMRALRDYRRMAANAAAAANALSTAVENLPAHVLALQEQLKLAHHELNLLRREKLLAGQADMLARAEALGEGWRLVAECVAADAGLLRDLASALIGHERTVALLAAESGDACLFVFGAAPGCPLDMGRLLSESVRPLGGKGGGRPDFAQGGGPRSALDMAAAAARAAFRRGAGEA